MQCYVLPPAFFIRYDKIDEEHVQLVALLNGLSASVEGGDPDDMLAQIQQFTQVLGAHFISEESLMAETRYPRYEEHCQQHQECLDRVISILGQLKALVSAILLLLSLIFSHFELCSTTAKHIDKGNQVAATKLRAINLAKHQGRGTPGRGREGGRGGRGGRGTTPAGCGTPRFEWSIPADKWAKMSAAEKQAHTDKVKVAKGCCN